MKMKGLTKFLPRGSVIFKLLEGTLAVMVLLFSRYGGMIHMGVDPVVRSKDQLDMIGNVPWGFTIDIHNFGIVVESAYVFIIFVLIVGMVNDSKSLGVGIVVLTLFNLFGFFFYASLSVIQYRTWVGLGEGQSIRYRDYSGVTPIWQRPTIPQVMAMTSGLLAFVFLLDLVYDYHLLREQTAGRKRVRFDSNPDLDCSVPKINKVLSKTPCEV